VDARVARIRCPSIIPCGEDELSFTSAQKLKLADWSLRIFGDL
jgi:hypothetical protein